MAIFDTSDTIAAVASPPGDGFRGIVRLSGPRAIEFAVDGFTADGPAPRPESLRRATRFTGRYRLPGLGPALPAALLLWPEGRSYTGQPLAEAHTVGSPPLVGAVLARFLTLGARPAERGEFTLRAFLSGRLDLTRAEAVLGVIDAKGPAQLDAALSQLAGGLYGPIAALRDRLLDVLAHLEATLDFVDEADVGEFARLELADRLAAGSAELANLAARLTSRERPEGRPRVVLVGPPNAGKSRLFNALLGEDLSLVSPLPGTTRDYLTAPLECDGVGVTLIDTAGAEAPRTEIEAAAQSLRGEQAETADLLLECGPADLTAGAVVSDPRRLFVTTKADLAADPRAPDGRIPTSAATGAGLDALKLAIASALREGGEGGSLATTTGARCREGLSLASEALASASEALAIGLGDELVAVDLRQALDELGKVVGATVTDDVLDRIFQRFCIGK